MGRKKNPKQVEIRWTDARSQDGWLDHDELEIRLANITTVGFLIHETKHLVCMAPSLDDKTNQMLGLLFIPKTSITSRRKR